MPEYVDRDVAHLLLAELARRGNAIIDAFEAATLRRVRAGEPLADACRAEGVGAARALVRLERDFGRVLDLAITETERRVLDHADPQ